MRDIQVAQNPGVVPERALSNRSNRSNFLIVNSA
jgi:hypothetical protein